MASNSSPSVGASTKTQCMNATTTTTERSQPSCFGYTYKAKWIPYQTAILVAKHINDYLRPGLANNVRFKDPTGNVHNILVNIHRHMRWFEDGVSQMMAFYNLHEEVYIYYTYIHSGNFDISIWKAQGEIVYPIIPKIEVINILSDTDSDEEEVASRNGMYLWKKVLSKANVGGKQGLVLPVNIVLEVLDEDQETMHVKPPNDHVQPWVLLWNTKVRKHCRFGQGWYQFCRKEKLQAGDIIEFWHYSGEHYVRVVVKRLNP
ncbi:DNA-binding barrel domain superfamily [Sesbania bispinosa]|nr:DNA-binding barrel domain superfamily [Sesbania bispinosa]